MYLTAQSDTGWPEEVLGYNHNQDAEEVLVLPLGKHGSELRVNIRAYFVLNELYVPSWLQYVCRLSVRSCSGCAPGAKKPACTMGSNEL